tara:strand:- start:592 stop:864 length:273 start_codon:yes stop_codon:yes gene_type:complete
MQNDDAIDPDQLPHFHVPEEFLNQLYDFTGGADHSSGFVLSYVDDRGRALVYCKTGSQIVEMGLRKALEKYLSEVEESESSFEINEETEE